MLEQESSSSFNTVLLVLDFGMVLIALLEAIDAPLQLLDQSIPLENRLLFSLPYLLEVLTLCSYYQMY